MSSHLHTFRSLLQEGVQLDNSILRIANITIPRLQRAYAQGRKSETELRNMFLNDIFNALNDNVVLELNFIYGTASSQVCDIGCDLELLDGQQRLTTLFLLYWYVANAELEKLPDYLHHFKYRTRTTSTDFIKELTERKIVIKESPSKTIQKLKWFSYAFTNDATINAMLTMLDAIDEKYKQYCNNNLFDRLENLKFYVLPLEGYGLSEELYIKMNARGLPLTPFENFKSDLIKYMKSDDRYQTDTTIGNIKKSILKYYLAFASKIDTRWIDLFWKKDETSSVEYNQRYFRFFYRYFFIKYVLDNKDKTAEDLRKDDNVLFFDDKSEKEQEDKYLHFNHYLDVIKSNPSKDYFRSIETILDVIYKYYADTIRSAIQYPFENGNEWDFFSEKSKYRRVNAIAFSAVIEYIDACLAVGSNVCESFDKKNFCRWMRIVWNMIENTNIDGIVPEINLIRSLSEIIHLEGATDSIYKALSKRVKTGTDSRSLSEEIDKATEIVNHPDEEWEKIFIEVEKHDFLRGMVGFFFTPDIGVEKFKHRYQLVQSMFDTDNMVIAEPYRKDALLLRAILAQLNSWYGGLKDLTFTQIIERKEFVLKNILASKQKVKDMFCRILDLNENEIMSALEKETEPKDVKDDKLNEWDKGLLQQAYHKLCTMPLMYEWMYQIEGWRHKSFRIQWLYGHIFAAVPYTSASRIVLDTERDNIVNRLITECGFYNIDHDQQNIYDKYHFYYGYNIKIEKEVDGYYIDMVFGMNHKYNVYLYVEDKMKRKQLFDYFKEKEYEPEYSNSEFIWLYEGEYNLLGETLKRINNAIIDLESNLHDFCIKYMA